MLSVCHLRAHCHSKRFRLVYKGTCLLYHALGPLAPVLAEPSWFPRVIPQCETELHGMTKIDSPHNTPELMDVSVIDINTWERAGAPAADTMQSAPIRGAISVPHVSCCIRVYMRFCQGRFRRRRFLAPLTHLFFFFPQ